MSADQVKLLVIAALFAGVAASAWVIKDWKDSGTIERLQGEKKVLEDQVQVLGESTRACSASVEQGKRLGELVVGQIRAQLAEIRKLHAGAAESVDRIEALIAQGTPTGAGCEKAWDKIEVDRKARSP